MLTTLALALLIPAAQDDKVPYAKPELLVEAAALKKEADRKAFVILDARRKAEYLVGHVPGAQWVDAAAWARGFGKDGKATWAGRFGALGIDTKSKVVIYDAVQNKDAARLWWILRYWGVKDVRLLNGGWNAYKSSGGELSKDVPEVKSVNPELTAQADRLATKDDLLKAIKEKALGQLVDSRSKEEHCGESTTAARNGAIPDAKHLEWSDTLDSKTGRFKSPDALAKVFKDAGIDVTKPATTYCQSGGRASVMAFALELAGGKPARNYYRSWAEWGNDEKTPVIKPEPKKKD
jgi:thiosulfate/3-mercaptopyruvate sulfurtransferase